MQFRFCATLVLGATALLVASCGGGGGGASTPPTPQATSATIGVTAGTPTPVPSPSVAPPTQTPYTPAPMTTPTPMSTVAPSGNVIVVGPGRQYTTIAAGVAAAHDGDTVDVVAGTYTNDFVVVNANITIQGVGGFFTMTANQTPSDEKGLIVVEKGLTIRNCELENSQDYNGTNVANLAGIRVDGGNVMIQYCHIHNNEEGFLGPNAGFSVTVDHSEFDHNGEEPNPPANNNDSGFVHNIYMNNGNMLTITNSYFHDVFVGHEVKSRAAATTILNSVIADGPTSDSSILIDIPNGGVADIENNMLEKGPNTQNDTTVHYSGTDTSGLPPVANNSFTMKNNTIIDDLGSNAILVANDAPQASLNVTAMLTGNTIYGYGSSKIVAGSANADLLTANTIYATTSGAPAVNTTPPWMSAPVIPVPATPHGVSPLRHR